MGTPSTTVGPGLGAFIAFFLLALALWLLMRNMSGRMRRMAYREQQRVAEMEAREQQAGPATKESASGEDVGSPDAAEAGRPAGTGGPRSPRTPGEPHAAGDDPAP